MSKMIIYEPAMCCSTGLCGIGVDPELLRISTVINNLKKNSIVVERFNLSDAPQEFINNNDVNKLLTTDGVEVLPIITVDGNVVLTKKYPTNKEIATMLNVSDALLGGDGKPATKVKVNRSRGCGCKGGCH